MTLPLQTGSGPSLVTGTHGLYYWLSTDKPYEDQLSKLCQLCPNAVLSKHLAVTSCDSGPLDLSDSLISTGWSQRSGISYSPRIESLAMLPPHAIWDEWYVFERPVDLGQIREGNIFDFSVRTGQVEVFVNFYNFGLNSPEVQDLVTRFWEQLEWIRPDGYLAQSDLGFFTFVTSDEGLFKQACQALRSGTDN
jgi:hypothetical protein